MVYYAKWTPIKATVTLDAVNGDTDSDGTASIDWTYDAEIPSIIIPTKAGYSLQDILQKHQGMAYSIMIKRDFNDTDQ